MCGIAQLSLLLFVSSSLSTSVTSIICLFKLVHLNDHLFDQYANNVVEEVNVKEALKLSISVVQKAAAPKNGVKFSQGSNGTIRSILAMSYDVWRHRVMSPAFDQSEAEKFSQINRQTENQHTAKIKIISQ